MRLEAEQRVPDDRSFFAREVEDEASEVESESGRDGKGR